MSFEIPGVLWRRDPQAAEVPLVFDSPHSGSEYPEDFPFCCALDVLRTAEDTYVDELYAAAPELGATLIGAIFPRSYLDPNRAADDLDNMHIDGTWPTPLSPSHRTRAGLGLVRRVARPGIPIYDRKLTAAEIMARVDRCHTPYHRVLEEACDRVHRKFGTVWHVNCHSMPSQRSGKKGGRCADFVLGDRDGTTCAPEFTDFVAVLLRGRGYTVRINELSPGESDEMLDRLFDFQLEQRFRYTHTWTENDLLVWDHLGTIHRAIADYGPDEIRLMRRCQVMATKVFDAEFLRPVRELMTDAA